MAKGFKTGGRKKGSLNKTTRKMRQLVNHFVYENLPKAKKALDGLWEKEPLEALALYTRLIEHVSPKMARVDPIAEQQAAQAAEQRTDAPPPVSIESVLAAFHAAPRVQRTETAPALPVPAAVPIGTAEIQPDPSLERLRHQGIPLPEPGMAYLPKPPPMPKPVERGAEPPMLKPVIEHEPVDPYANSRQPSGCRPLIMDDDDHIALVAAAGRR